MPLGYPPAIAVAVPLWSSRIFRPPPIGQGKGRKGHLDVRCPPPYATMALRETAVPEAMLGVPSGGHKVVAAAASHVGLDGLMLRLDHTAVVPALGYYLGVWGSRRSGWYSAAVSHTAAARAIVDISLRYGLRNAHAPREDGRTFSAVSSPPESRYAQRSWSPPRRQWL